MLTNVIQTLAEYVFLYAVLLNEMHFAAYFLWK